MKVLIVDDENPGALFLMQLLKDHDDVSVVGHAKNVKEALSLTASYSPELIFLDVRLRGQTGFDFLAQFSEPWPKIVFVTAFDHYAVRAFETNALDYLLKPVEPERLAVSLQRARANQTLQPTAPELEDRVMLKVDHELKWVPWKDIQDIRSEGNFTIVNSRTSESWLVSKSLKDWLALLPEGFIQVHRQHLVSKECMRSLETESRTRKWLYMENGQKLPVSRAYWPLIKKHFSKTE